MTVRACCDQRQFRVFFEVNQSYDWNEYYSKDRFPEDMIYSGSGSVGQPSIIYMAEIDLDDNFGHYLLRPVGHGHHSGQNGEIDPDLEKIDSALEIVDRVTVSVKKRVTIPS